MESLGLEKTDFDVIVVGTGLTESVVASALARAGKSVLHLDAAPYYGSAWATLSFKQLQAFSSSFEVASGSPLLDEASAVQANATEALQDGIQSIPVDPQSQDWISGVEYEIVEDPAQPCVSSSTEQTAAGSTEGNGDTALQSGVDSSPIPATSTPSPAASVVEDMLKQSRHYNLDLNPKLILAKGEFVKLLIESDVGRYLEFKSLEGIYLYSEHQFLQVPTSQDSIFSSSVITNPERLALRKFMKFCFEFSSEENSTKLDDTVANTPFVKFLDSYRLSPRLRQFILYSIGLLEQSQDLSPCLTGEALPRIKAFIQSIGVYGPSPFLVPLYGSGELPQAFCRLSAIYGGIYILRHWPQQLHFETQQDELRFMGLTSNEGIRFTAKHFIGASPYVAAFLNKDKKRVYSRCICITDKPLTPSQEMILASIPPGQFSNQQPIRILQSGSLSSNAPKGKYVVSLTTISSGGTAKEELASVVANITQETNDGGKPRRFWCMYFTQTFYDELLVGHPQNVHITPDPSGDIDPSPSVNDAKKIFQAICPDQLFLQKPVEQEVYPEDTEEYLEAVALEKLQQTLSKTTIIQPPLDAEDNKPESSAANLQGGDGSQASATDSSPQAQTPVGENPPTEERTI
eukprot:TRINITY_DN2938_c0_g1_i3.p1 TRINITY_DN2938_c0_g1~~TRINITY_DN2938_c0_g1_i3.p1  ORF type:complete len:632 (-),score=144.15 TRINITY_DN2938_c0_g1_i3:233-2128(-)